MKVQVRLILGVVVAGLSLFSSPAFATDGMNPIAFDARAAAMGGADTALGTALSMTNNPAGLTSVGMRLDTNVTMLVPQLTFSDRVQGQTINTPLKGKTSVFPLFGIAFATPVTKGLHVGFGVFVQGGMGADFSGVGTYADMDPMSASQPQLGSYDVKSEVMYIKFAPTIAYRYRFISLGASLHLGAAKMSWKHTGMPFPEQDGDHLYMLNTLDFESGYAFGVAGRFGAQAHFFDNRLRFGVSYMMEAKPRFDGDLTISNPGGTMEYDAGTDDFGWARELAVGVAGQLFNRRLTLAADFRWVDWSSAVDVIDFAPTAKDASRVPPGYEQIPLAFNMKWQDTLVFGAGAEFAAIPEFLLVRAGYNYGRAPATPTGINALFPPVNAHHITGGIGLVNIYKNLSLNAAFEWALPGEVESDETNMMAYEPSFDPSNMQATGYSAAVKMQQFSAYLTASYQFN